MNRSILTRKVQIKTEVLAAMLLLVVLAGLTTLLIAETGNTYKNLVSTSETSQEIRTALNFAATKVRQAPNESGVTVEKSPWGQDSIVISRNVDGAVYEDWLFYYDGAFREILIPKGSTINPGSSQLISKLDSAHIEKSGSLILISVTKSDTSHKSTSGSITLSLRT